MHVRNAQEWRVYRNGQLTPELQPLRVQESFGAQRMDHAELLIDPKMAKRMQDYSPLKDMGANIRIEAVGVGVKHVGIVGQVQPVLSPQGETFKLISQAQPHLFGRPSGGVVVLDPSFPAETWNPDGLPQPNGKFKLVDDPIVFNPEIDGRVFGNMHGAIVYGPAKINVFLHPNSVKTEAAQRLHQGKAINWPLSAAVYYLCHWMNQTQLLFRNPSREELERAFDDSVDLLRNVQVEEGQYLPEVLDALVGPLGYHWRTKKGVSRKPRIEFYRRATGGSLVWLNHQRFGEIFDPKKTNVEANGVVFDADRLANRIIGRGSKLQIELTAELCRAWDPKFDEWDRDDFKKGNITAEVETEHPGISNAWRKWVLNESGEYAGTRPEITSEFPPGVKARLQAAGLLEWMLPRRRRFLPTLTQTIDGTTPIGNVDGIEVEWHAGDGEWRPTNWEIAILEHECGIFINNDELPEELIDAGADASIRVTATIETLFRITATAERRQSSPLLDDQPAMLDLESQFHWREVTALSKYKNSGLPSDAQDDRARLQTYVEEIRERFDNLDVAGAVTLEGVDQHLYEVGDRVAGVKGKQISFRSRSDGIAYPQIAAITYDVESQKTVLQMQRHRETVVI